MPYIKQEARADIAGGRPADHIGELVFVLTRQCVNALAEEGALTFTGCFRIVRDLTIIQHEIAQGGVQLQARPTALCQTIAQTLSDYKDNHPTSFGPNDAVGALECVKLEFYRRVVVPHEDIKCNENGDAYHPFRGVA